MLLRGGGGGGRLWYVSIVCCGSDGKGGCWCCTGCGVCFISGGGWDGTVGGAGGGTEVDGKGGMALDVFIFISVALFKIGGGGIEWLSFKWSGGAFCTLLLTHCSLMDILDEYGLGPRSLLKLRSLLILLSLILRSRSLL